MHIIVDSMENCASLAADRYCALLREKPKAVLGLATGSTPEALYRELIRRCRAGEISFAQATTFNLDEYVGLDGTHLQSYRYFMNSRLFDRVDIDIRRTNVPSGLNMTSEKAAQYDELIRQAGGIDLQLLGIGPNGHIGFNEPGGPWDSVTHIADLAPATRQANSRFFESLEEVPTQAVSMGIKTVMNARHILVMAFGEGKAPAVAAMVKGRVDRQVPASILQLHPDVTVFADPAAAALI